MKPPRPSLLITLVLLFALFLAACGDDDDSREESTSVAEQSSTAPAAAVKQDDGTEAFHDEPDAQEEVPEETLTIRDGEIDSSTLDIELGTRVLFANEGEDVVQLTMQRESSADELGGGRLSDFLSVDIAPGDAEAHDFNQLGVYHLSSETHPGLAKTIRVHQY